MNGKFSIEELKEMEDQFAGRGDTEHEYGWAPFPISLFLPMIAVAAPAVPPGAYFLEAGCGIGTKMYIAREQFGLQAIGYDNKAELIEHATHVLNVRAYIGDIKSAPYEMADIVYLSRPLKDDGEEASYEIMVHGQVRNGSILMAAWAAVKPPWHILYRSGQHGVWRKPEDGKPVPRLATPPVGQYENMIQRQQPHDPLVQEPIR